MVYSHHRSSGFKPSQLRIATAISSGFTSGVRPPKGGPAIPCRTGVEPGFRLRPSARRAFSSSFSRRLNSARASGEIASHTSRDASQRKIVSGAHSVRARWRRPKPRTPAPSHHALWSGAPDSRAPGRCRRNRNWQVWWPRSSLLFPCHAVEIFAWRRRMPSIPVPRKAIPSRRNLTVGAGAPSVRPVP